jgi:hypothetical protein
MAMEGIVILSLYSNYQGISLHTKFYPPFAQG